VLPSLDLDVQPIKLEPLPITKLEPLEIPKLDIEPVILDLEIPVLVA